jgi:hypothetical protein
MHIPRTIRTHECTEADKLLTIHAGPDGKGGAPHYYEICYLVFNADGVSAGSRCKTIQFQDGPICENGLNGITIESLLAIAEDRLERFQKGSFACMENERALTSIRSAMYHLHERTRRRQREHAEGSSAPDGSAPSPLAGEGRGEGSPPSRGAGVPPVSSPPSSDRSESLARGLRSAHTTPPAYTGDARAVAEQL